MSPDPVHSLLQEAYAVAAARPQLERIHLRSGQALRSEIGLHEASMLIAADSAVIAMIVTAEGRFADPSLEGAAATFETLGTMLRVAAEAGVPVDDRLVAEVAGAIATGADQVMAARGGPR